MWRSLESKRGSYTGRIAPPGMPNTTSAPASSRERTTDCAPVMGSLVGREGVGTLASRGGAGRGVGCGALAIAPPISFRTIENPSAEKAGGGCALVGRRFRRPRYRARLVLLRRDPCAYFE